LWEYLRHTNDDAAARPLFDVADRCLTDLYRDTALGVRADPNGLLLAGSPASAVTWMNAQVNDVPMTPRHGRPVEVNALWYNALRIGAELARRFHQPARSEELFTLATRARLAFND